MPQLRKATGPTNPGACWWAVRRVTRPLADLARAADGLGQDLKQAPLPETGPQEVAQANRAFNRMQQALRTLIQTRAQALAGVSHDLRLPITRLEGKRKLSQNRNAADRAGVAAGLAASNRATDRQVAALIPA